MIGFHSVRSTGRLVRSLRPQGLFHGGGTRMSLAICPCCSCARQYEAEQSV